MCDENSDGFGRLLNIINTSIAMDWRRMRVVISLILLLVVCQAHVAASQALPVGSLDPKKVLTNPNRTQNVGRYCTVPRSQLVDSSDMSLAVSYGNTVNMSFQINPLDFVQQALKLNRSNVFDFANKVTTGIALTSGPFIIGFLLVLFLWPFLLCCCVCPDCCPSKCCQHDPNRTYSKCELAWPAIVMILAGIMAVGSSIPGIMVGPKLTEGIQSFECAYSIVLDDLMNGNITADGNAFFAGSVMLDRTILDLRSNLGAISNNLLTHTQPKFQAFSNAAGNAQTALSKLPNQTSPNAAYILTYTDPTPGETTGSVVTSSYGAVLGTNSQSGSLCGSVSGAVNSLSASFNQLAVEIAGLDGVSPQIVSQISSISVTIENSTSAIITTDNGTISAFDNIESYGGYIRTCSTVYHGTVFALCALAIVAAAVTVFMNKPDCRYVLYGVCVPIVLVSILGMIVALALSVLMPGLYITCSIATDGLSSPSNFQKYMDAFKLSGPGSAGLSMCLPGGSGSFFDGLGQQGAQLNTELAFFMSVMNDVKTASELSKAPLNSAQANLETTTALFINAGINDISQDAASDAWFRGLANRQIPTSCEADETFLLDSLVPSTEPGSLTRIPCASNTQIVSCADFSNCPSGCIDMYKVMAAAGSLGVFQNQIANRYKPPCVANITAQLSTNYQNWFEPRTNPASGIVSVANRWSSNTVPTLTILDASMTALQQQLAAEYSSINSIIPQVIDPINGLYPGLNCLTMGEDINLFKNTVCVNIFNRLYLSLVTIGISSFAMLLLTCCLVCSGVRQYKQLTKLQIKKYWQIRAHPDTYYAINEPHPYPSG